MKALFLAVGLSLVQLIPTGALAQTDCYHDMKDMVRGTLDTAHQAELRNADDRSYSCTLADWQDRNAVPDAQSTTVQRIITSMLFA